MKNWIKRSIRTFLQAAVGYIVVSLPTVDWKDGDILKTTLVGIGVSAVAAGCAAVLNFIEDKQDKKNDTEE